jgi:hypothetical protein
MDMTAVSLCKDNDMPMIIFNMNKPGNILRVVSGERVGSLVTARLPASSSSRPERRSRAVEGSAPQLDILSR